MKDITILIVIDGIRFDYVYRNECFFLKFIKNNGISSALLPTFGFKPDAAYIAGLYPDEADGLAQFWYNPINSPFGFTKYLSKNLDWLPQYPDIIIRKIITKIARHLNKVPTLSTARIPLHTLQYIDLSMKGKIEDPIYDPNKSIFDVLRDYRKTWLYHSSPEYRVDIDSVARRVEKDLLPPKSFAFLFIGNLDKVGHRYGPESNKIKKTLRIVDEGIEHIINIAKKRFENIHLIIIGDHGMMQVKRTLDIMSGIKKLPVELGKDYLFFLDSTMARFWFFSDKGEKLISELLGNILLGHILSQEEKQKYHLNYSHNKFGDIIFLADPGVLIFPNFYQNKKTVKGMHGYAPETPEQQSTLLIHSPRIKSATHFEKPVDMRRVFPTVLDLLDLPIPDKTKLKSLLQ